MGVPKLVDEEVKWGKTAILLTGGFDPIHVGHLAMFRQSKLLFDVVVVGINSDAWLLRKKLKAPFMGLKDRKEILQSIKYIDEVIEFKDDDGHAVRAIEKSRASHSNLVFGNGGDRLPENTPELKYCLENNIPIMFNVGGGKIESSSKLLSNYND